MLEPVKESKGYYAIRRKCDCSQLHATNFKEKIRRIFGFDDANGEKTLFTTFIRDAQRNIVAQRPASLSRAIPDQLYVYTDICKPYAVGDTQASLLRIVSLDNSKFKYGCSAVQRFAPAHYIPLLYHKFNNIIIDIRDQHGHRIPSGTSTEQNLRFSKRNLVNFLLSFCFE